MLNACTGAYTGILRPELPVHLYPRFSHHGPHVSAIQVKRRDMRRICYPIFVRIFNCVPRLAIANPIQFCGSYATHLCTRQFSLGSSFASYLIFSYLKVGQINTSSVPRGIAMVCHDSYPSAFNLVESTLVCPGKDECVAIRVSFATKLSAITSPLFQTNVG